jgi:Flp pilus assembly protein TadB
MEITRERYSALIVAGFPFVLVGLLTWMAPGAPEPATASNASLALVSGKVCVEIWSMGSLPEAMNWMASSTAR